MNRVLIVNDCEESLSELHGALTALGLEVDVAFQGDGALASARRDSPDLVISELMMPVMDGLTLMRHWKADARLASIPFVIIAAKDSQEEDEQSALELGADGFLSRPWEPGTLNALICSLLATVPAGDGRLRGHSAMPAAIQNELLKRKLEEQTLKLAESNRELEELAANEREQRELVQMLTAERTRLLTAQGVAKVGSWEMDIATTAVKCSDEIDNIFSIGRLPSSHRSFLKLVHPEDRGRVNRAFASSLTSASLHTIRHRLVLEDGRIRHVEQRWQVIADGEGAPIRAIGTCQDITERKQAEVERDRLFNLSGDLLCVARFDSYLEQVNPAWTKCLGWSAAELMGRSSMEFVHPDDREYTLHAGIELVQGQSVQFENRYCCKDGSLRWMAWSSHPLPETRQVFSVGRDISRRKLVETAMVESEERFRQLAENVSEVFWLTDFITNELLYISPAYERIWGRPAADLHASPDAWHEFIHDDDRERVLLSWNTKQAAGEYDETYRIVRPAGDIRWVRDRAFPVTNAEGVVYRMVGTSEDITDRKVVELELAHSNRALQIRSACSHAIMRSANERQLLNDVCRLAVEVGGYRMAWVGYALENEERSIRPMAHAGEEQGYLSLLKLSWFEENAISRGPAGQTILTGKAVIYEDIMAGTGFSAWREDAQVRGYRSLICLPLRDENRTFGLLGLYSSSVSQPGGNELKLLQEFVDDFAFGIGNLRFQNERRRMQKAVLKVATNVSASSNTNFFAQLATSMAEALGAEAGYIARLLPGEPLTARTVAVAVDGKSKANFNFAVKDSPCAGLIDSAECFVTSKVSFVATLAPRFAGLNAQVCMGLRLTDSSGQMLGMVFVLFRELFTVSDFLRSTLQIFATRVAAELERQKADALLRDQASLLDKAQDAIVVLDLNNEILFWNSSAERLYGWSTDEAVGQCVSDLLYPDTAAFDAAMRATIDRGEWVGEIEQFTKDGKSKTVEGRWSLVRDDEGLPKSVLAVSTDITERKKLEQQFLRAQRMESIGTLAGGIAHDLNNVLAPIMMSIDLLQLRETNPMHLNILSTIASSARRGADMVQQVLLFARGVDGQQLEVQIGPLLKEIEKIVHETFPKDIRVTSNFSFNLWSVQGDPTQLHQVLLNLCVNARDAMPHGGKLTITASNLLLDEQFAVMNIEAKPGPHVLIEVDDTGTGIPPDVVERIFEPFFTTKDLGKGTGLGLSTTLAIIKSHGGFAQVKSEPDVSTRFRIYLPAMSPSTLALGMPVVAELPYGKGELILVVDDEPSVLAVTRQTLESFGYQVIVAEDGAEAVALYATRMDDVAVVLTDMMMPVMDGPATIRVLVSLNPDVKIIAVSGLISNAQHTQGVNGVKHFLPKPYTAELLLTSLRQLLD